jgi:hypothetical protein
VILSYFNLLSLALFCVHPVWSMQFRVAYGLCKTSLLPGVM